MTEGDTRLFRLRSRRGVRPPGGRSLYRERACTQASFFGYLSHAPDSLEVNRATQPAVLLACILSFMSPILPAGATPPALAPCPDSPNCVSSQSGDAAHFTEALRYKGDAAQAWQRLQSALGAEPRITIIDDTGSYLHAEARSLVFRFVDDVEFLLDSAHGVIQVRSASRVGYSDFGVNRRRVERIRKAFRTQP
jgi:uncharacterized protein (DUF1499 family)